MTQLYFSYVPTTICKQTNLRHSAHIVGLHRWLPSPPPPSDGARQQGSCCQAVFFDLGSSLILYLGVGLPLGVPSRATIARNHFDSSFYSIHTLLPVK